MNKRNLLVISIISMACASSIYAAQPIDLKHKPSSILQSFMPNQLSASANTGSSIKETSSNVDFNQTKHIRIKQTYAGYPVWGSDAVVHIPHGNHVSLNHLTPDASMNGLLYQGIKEDLANSPNYVFSSIQADKALQQAVELYQKKTGINQYDKATAKKTLMVYIDKSNKAHWVYYISFLSTNQHGAPAVPTYILDAVTFRVYEEWNNMQTIDGGGYGGNPKMGKLIYDGLNNHYPVLNIKRNDAKKVCTLENDNVIVKDDNKKNGPFGSASVAEFKCDNKNTEHNNVFWSGDTDLTNEGYSPANDALYIGQVIKEMYQNWYGIPVLSFLGIPMKIKMNVHARDFSGQAMDNAFFLPLTKEMYFGDGVKMFYPLTSLGVGAHEISHGFTSQHSNLTYQKQSGGLNESFSDMAAQAAEFYSVGHNSWQIGPEIVKADKALRYMDDPTKDGRSIGHVKDYTDDLNVHLTSGIFNKVFYLLGTSPGWDTKKAFNVMVNANINYWTANTTFDEAACGVMKATQDYHYDTSAVSSAMSVVGIDVSHC